MPSLRHFPEERGITRHAVAALHRRRDEPRRSQPAPAGLKPRTVRYVHTIVHAALRDALRWNRVARNVADAATPPPVGSVRHGRPGAWTSDQLRRFLDFVADSRYLPAWVFLATTGCRRGECLGLQWGDLDLDAGMAVMSRQVTAVDHELRIKELPKTKRGHMIRLDSGTVGMLRRWRARQAEEKLLVGTGYEDRDFVFCHPDGSVYEPNRFSREFVRKQLQHNRAHPDAPLPRLVLHGLRHTWATLALHEGIDIQVVSERLNHSSTHVTREIYTHVTPPMQSDAAEHVAARIFRPL
jgi:integrase